MRATRLLASLLLLALAAFAAHAAGDTGTYRILQYRVQLTPHSDGKTDIDYYQQWRVTGGHVPWVSVGLPNADFEITKSGDAVKSIAPDNEGDWYGVHIDLDKDYQSGQTFTVSFSVSENKLFSEEGDAYKLEFTPGWYDRAVIDSLEIRLKSFAKTETITADPEPASRSEEELVWTKTGLREGERFPISVSFPKSVAPAALPQENLRGEGQPEPEGEPDTGPSTAVGSIAATLVILFVVLVALSFLAGPPGRRRYTGGGIFYGGGPWWGGGGGGSGGGGRSTGGGGGFGGSGFSCACACACAGCGCACACAGGGGAGCSRKQQHRCPLCEEAAWLTAMDRRRPPVHAEGRGERA